MKRHLGTYFQRSAKFLTVGSFLLSLFLILIGIVLFVTGPFQQSQELRRSAMTPSGTVQLDFAPVPGTSFAATESASFDIKLIPYTVQPSKVTFAFDLITHETIDVSDVVFHQETGIRKDALSFKRVDHGYTVEFEGQFPDGGAHGASETPVTILTVNFHPKKAGTVAVSFDPEKSKVFASNNDQIVDELRTVNSFNYTIQAPPLPPEPPTVDDLFFGSLDSDHTKLTFYTVNTNAEVAAADLQSGAQYKIVHTSTIQNLKKSAIAPTTNITVQLRANSTITIRNTVPYSEVSTSASGKSVQLEGIFTAGTTNTFTISIDPDGQYPERTKDNNNWSISYESTAGTGGTTTKQCNEVCTTNSDCRADQRCYDTGSDKRCRLATNVTSTSCAAAPDQGLRRSCNDYCADTRECASGFTCWYNRCRVLQNLESTSCRLPQRVPISQTTTTKGGLSTTTTAISYQSCNENCSSNRDCKAGLRCYQGSCRNPLQVNSLTCSSSDTAGPTTASTPRPTPTPKTTASPTATTKPGTTVKTTPSPTATPILITSPKPASTSAQATATPAATLAPATPSQPEVVDDTSPFTVFTTIQQQLQRLWNGFTQWLSTSLATVSTTPNSELYGLSLPYLIIGVGFLLLLVAILVMLFSRKRFKPGPLPPPVPPAPKPETVLGGKPHANPLPPKEILARRTSPDANLIKSVSPVAQTLPTKPSNFSAILPAPKPQPTVTPAAPALTPIISTIAKPDTSSTPGATVQTATLPTPVTITKPSVAPEPTGRPTYTPAIPITIPPKEPVAAQPQSPIPTTVQTQVAPKPVIVAPSQPDTPPPQPHTPALGASQPASAVPNQAPAPAVIEKAPLPAKITHELPTSFTDRMNVLTGAIKQKHQTDHLPPTPDSAAVTPLVPPAPSTPPVSPVELLKQASEDKVTMADRLKLKGVVFSQSGSRRA